MVSETALEARTLLTGLVSGLDLAEAADELQNRTVDIAGRLEKNVTAGPSGIQGASRPGRTPGSSIQPVRMARRPPGRPIVPARNANRLTMPTLLPASMTGASTMQLEGAWTLRVTTQAGSVTRSAVVDLPAPSVQRSTDSFASLPVFDPSAFGWLKGHRLTGMSAQEGVVSGALDAGSIVVRLTSEPVSPETEGHDEDGEPIEIELIRGIDFEIDPYWGTIGRLAGGRIGESDAVTVTYQHLVRRLDAVILQADGQIVVRTGEASNEHPVSPVPFSGEKLLGRVFVSEFRGQANPDDLYPVISAEPPDWPVARSNTVAGQLSQIMRKLKNGKELRILAWGDSVTDGIYLPDPSVDRWQNQFVSRLKTAFPRARITLITEAWPGHGMADYLAAGPGETRSFESAVVGVRPDLVISEFVNDGYLSQAKTVTQYAQVQGKLREAGIGWIVMTPHFTHQDFMGPGASIGGGSDPRRYVQGLKDFGSLSGVIVADASALWADLKRQGMPYQALLSNGINHPNAYGQNLYAEALMRVFTK